MIAIDIQSPHIAGLTRPYCQHVEKFFGIHPANLNAKKTKDKSKLQKLSAKAGVKGTLYASMLLYFQDNHQMILTAGPDQLKALQQEMYNKIGFNENEESHQKEFQKFKKKMSYYYTELFKEKINSHGELIPLGRWLTRSLGISVCPFCNRNYTITIHDAQGEIGARPDFDHFLPKSHYPLLSISFFNLVPICTPCNKIKGENEIFQSPYDSSHPVPVFKLYGKDKDNKPVLLGLGDAFEDIQIIPEASSAQNNPDTCNIKKLGLKQIYENHTDHVSELVSKAQQYHMDSYAAMIESFQGLGKTEGEIDRIIWGRYKDDPGKRPLSKLTNDVLDQLGL
jgi:hypothetical protein